MKAAEEALESDIENDCDYETRQALEDKLNQMKEDYENRTGNSNWFLQNQLVEGAKEIRDLIDSAENEEKRRMTKQAFIFRSAVRLYAGFINAQHFAMELTGRRTMLQKLKSK